MTTSVRIQTGHKEPIEVLVFDSYGERLVGATDISVKIRRQSDNALYDWSDNTFKASGSVVQTSQTLSEIDSVFFKGEYKLNSVDHVNGFDTSAIANPTTDDIYEVTVDQTPKTTASNLPVIGEIKVGHFVDDIPDFTENERLELKEILGVTGTGTPDDTPSRGVLAVILGLVQSNFFLDQTIYNSQGLLTAGRIRIFPGKAETDAATDGGTGEGELAEFKITTEPEATPLDGLAKTYRVTKE